MPDSPVQYLRKCSLGKIHTLFPTPFMYVCMYWDLRLTAGAISRGKTPGMKKTVENLAFFYLRI